MSTVEELLDQPPVATSGLKTTHSDWDLVVEIAVPGSPSSLWGVAEWDTDVWTTAEWTDITRYVRGMEWQRGIEELGGRPRVGVAQITLDNHEYRFSPVDPGNSLNTLVRDDGMGGIINGGFGPGTVVRISAINVLGNTPVNEDTFDTFDTGYWYLIYGDTPVSSGGVLTLTSGTGNPCRMTGSPQDVEDSEFTAIYKLDSVPTVASGGAGTS